MTQALAALWRRPDQVVYTRTLETLSSTRTRIECDFDPDAVRRRKAAAAHNISVGGATLAGLARKAGLVDECHLFVTSIAVGGGQPFLPQDVRWQLELVDEHRFGSVVVYLHYAIAR